jgi:hypothetical protein
MVPVAGDNPNVAIAQADEGINQTSNPTIKVKVKTVLFLLNVILRDTNKIFYDWLQVYVRG